MKPGEGSLPVCPVCGDPTKRKCGIPGIKFKGSGFHIRTMGCTVGGSMPAY